MKKLCIIFIMIVGQSFYAADTRCRAMSLTVSEYSQDSSVHSVDVLATNLQEQNQSGSLSNTVSVVEDREDLTMQLRLATQANADHTLRRQNMRVAEQLRATEVLRAAEEQNNRSCISRFWCC